MPSQILPTGILVWKQTIKFVQRHLTGELGLMGIALLAHIRIIAQSYLSVKYRILAFTNDPYEWGLLRPHRILQRASVAARLLRLGRAW
jgi:hypothetical protein